MSHRRVLTLIIASIAALALTACDSSKSSEKSAEHDPAHQGQEHHSHEGEGHDHAHEGEEHHHGEEADESAEETASVTVPKEGKEFDPAVSVDKLPEGAWACDMGGTSHYAAMQKGDGRCPVCNMMLSKVE